MDELSALHLFGLMISAVFIGGWLLFGVIYSVNRYDRGEYRSVWWALGYLAAGGAIVLASLLSLDL